MSAAMTKDETERMNRVLAAILTSLDESSPSEAPEVYLKAAIDALGEGALFPAAMLFLMTYDLVTLEDGMVRVTAQGHAMADRVRQQWEGDSRSMSEMGQMARLDLGESILAAPRLMPDPVPARQGMLTPRELDAAQSLMRRAEARPLHGGDIEALDAVERDMLRALLQRGYLKARSDLPRGTLPASAPMRYAPDTFVATTAGIAWLRPSAGAEWPPGRAGEVKAGSAPLDALRQAARAAVDAAQDGDCTVAKRHFSRAQKLYDEGLKNDVWSHDIIAHTYEVLRKNCGHRYRVTYQDEYDADNRHTLVKRAFSPQEVEELFHDAPDSEGWEIISVEKLPPG